MEAGVRRVWWKLGGMGAGVLLALVLFLGVNYLSHRHYARWDWTRSQVYSLSEKSKKVVAALPRPVTVTVLFDQTEPLYDEVKELLDRYAAASSKIAVRYLDVDRNRAEVERVVADLGISQMNSVVFTAGADKRYVEKDRLAEYDYSGMQFGEPPKITKFKAEEEFTGALLGLSESSTPRLLFVTGHGERSLASTAPEGYSEFKDALTKQNFTVEEWQSISTEDVPEGTAVLVIAGPMAAFTNPELRALELYLQRDGSILALVDPVIQGARVPETEAPLGELLTRWGAQIGNDIVVDPASRARGFGLETVIVASYGMHRLVAPLAGPPPIPTVLPLARSVSPAKVSSGKALESYKLLLTTGAGWGETELSDPSAIAPGPGDLRGPVCLAVAVGAKETPTGPPHPEEMEEEPSPSPSPAKAPTAQPRLVVVGDADFLANGRFFDAGNRSLGLNAVDWLASREALLGIPPRIPEQVSLTLSGRQMGQIQILTLLVLPACAILLGVVVWYRRRN